MDQNTPFNGPMNGSPEGQNNEQPNVQNNEQPTNQFNEQNNVQPTNQFNGQNYGQPVDQFNGQNYGQPVDQLNGQNYGQPVDQFNGQNYGQPVNQFNGQNYGQPVDQFNGQNYGQPVDQFNGQNYGQPVNQFNGQNYGQPVNQFNGQQNTQQNNNKTKTKKGGKKAIIIILSIILIAIIALIIVYALVINKPEFVFSQAINKVLTMPSENYDTEKFELTVRPTFEINGITNDALGEIVLNASTQLDYNNKQAILNLGLQYNDESVVSGEIYYEDNMAYVFLNELYDKAISVDLASDSNSNIGKIDENSEDTKKALEIIKKEIKNQLNENATFEKSKENLQVNGEEKSVTKNTIILNEEQLTNLIKNVCTNLKNNESFLSCFEESPESTLQNLIDQMNNNKTIDNENKITLDIYTDGIFFNFVGFKFDIYSVESDLDNILIFTKQSDTSYAFECSSGNDSFSGTVDIKPTEDTNTGDINISLNADNGGIIGMDISYKTIYNEPIDTVDTTNTVDYKELTDADYAEILQNLLQRPLIKDFFSQIGFDGNGIDQHKYDPTEPTEPLYNESQDSVTNGNYTVTYSLPLSYTIDSTSSMENSKVYTDAGDNIRIQVGLSENTDDETLIQGVEAIFNQLKETSGVTNVENSGTLVETVGNNQYYHNDFSCIVEGISIEIQGWWTRIDSENVYSVLVMSYNTPIPDDLMDKLLNVEIE